MSHYCRSKKWKVRNQIGFLNLKLIDRFLLAIYFKLFSDKFMILIYWKTNAFIKSILGVFFNLKKLMKNLITIKILNIQLVIQYSAGHRNSNIEQIV